MGKQLHLFMPSRTSFSKTDFGGSLLKGRRKAKRPLNFKRSHHFVLKSEKDFPLLLHRDLVAHILQKYSPRSSVKIYSMAIHCDHIHFCLKFDSREAYVKWIRSVTSRLVARIAGLKFTLRPWSRVVEWGRAFKRLQQYIATNQLEADLIGAAWEQIERLIRHFGPEIERRHEGVTVQRGKPSRLHSYFYQ